MNQQGEFRSYNNQIDTNCMHLVSIWLKVLQRVLEQDVSDLEQIRCSSVTDNGNLQIIYTSCSRTGAEKVNISFGTYLKHIVPCHFLIYTGSRTDNSWTPNDSSGKSIL